MVFTIEPMINAGKRHSKEMPDGQSLLGTTPYLHNGNIWLQLPKQVLKFLLNGLMVAESIRLFPPKQVELLNLNFNGRYLVDSGYRVMNETKQKNCLD